MRRTIIGTVAACLVGFFLFLLAPAFRQAFGVSLEAWRMAFAQTGYSTFPASQLSSLAARAEKERDAKTLAFVSLVRWRNPQNARVADEAVRLDPKLTWIYFDMALRDPENPEVEQWISRLRAWDPANATPILLEAERHAQVDVRVYRHSAIVQAKHDAQWLGLMAQAFAAPKYDPYIGRRIDLDRKVLREKHLEEPMHLLRMISAFPVPNFADLHAYAQYLLDRGQQEEAADHLKEAQSDYWTVARFGQREQAGASTDIQRFEAWGILEPAYQRLQASAEKAGNTDEAHLFAYLITDIQQARKNLMASRQGGPFYAQDAMAVQLASMALMLSLALMAGSGVYLIAVRAWRQTHGSAARAAPAVLCVAGAVGALISSASVYFSYQPFAETFNRYIASAGRADPRTIWAFWSFLDLPLSLPSEEVLISCFFLTLAGALMVFEAIRVWNSLLRPRAAN